MSSTRFAPHLLSPAASKLIAIFILVFFISAESPILLKAEGEEVVVVEDLWSRPIRNRDTTVALINLHHPSTIPVHMVSTGTLRFLHAGRYLPIYNLFTFYTKFMKPIIKNPCCGSEMNFFLIRIRSRKFRIRILPNFSVRR